MYSSLISLDEPYFHVAVCDFGSVDDWALTEQSGCASLCIRLVRGNKMRDRQQLFDEFAAAFNSPTTSVRIGTHSTTA